MSEPKALVTSIARITSGTIARQLREDKLGFGRSGAIDLAHALGINEPRVAILSAVETVTPLITSTIDAAALCKIAERDQITGGVLDGPLAFDNALDFKAAEIKRIRSPVAGRADLLVVPPLESGNILAKQLEYPGGSRSGGSGPRCARIDYSNQPYRQCKDATASAAVAALVLRQRRQTLSGLSLRQ